MLRSSLIVCVLFAIISLNTNANEDLPIENLEGVWGVHVKTDAYELTGAKGKIQCHSIDDKIF